MGQTQILFIVLSVIIVGIAVAVGITQFGSNATQANLSACELDAQDLGSKMQLWLNKPTSLGGGGGAFTGVTCDLIGATDADGDASQYTNDNGVYKLASISATQATIQVFPKSSPSTEAMSFTVTASGVQKDATPQ